MAVSGLKSRIARGASVVVLAFGLSGCVVAAIPLMVAAGWGVAGFAAYKTVQLTGGGSIHVQFPSQDGKTAPAQPLPAFKRVAVWPRDAQEVRLAEKLKASGHFTTVVPPSAVSGILADAKTPIDLKQLTAEEQTAGFDRVCDKAKVEFVFASRDLGTTANNNILSFSAANVTSKADLMGYSCTQHAVVWKDQIALVIEGGGEVSTSSAEVTQAGGDAWADRVLEGMGFTPPPKPATPPAKSAS